MPLGVRKKREIGDGERETAYAEDVGSEVGDLLFDVVVRTRTSVMTVMRVAMPMKSPRMVGAARGTCGLGWGPLRT